LCFLINIRRGDSPDDFDQVLTYMLEDGLITPTRDLECMWSIEKIKKEYPQFKEILEYPRNLSQYFLGLICLQFQFMCIIQAATKTSIKI
jgi:hypothetical protein